MQDDRKIRTYEVRRTYVIPSLNVSLLLINQFSQFSGISLLFTWAHICKNVLFSFFSGCNFYSTMSSLMTTATTTVATVTLVSLMLLSTAWACEEVQYGGLTGRTDCAVLYKNNDCR